MVTKSDDKRTLVNMDDNDADYEANEVNKSFDDKEEARDRRESIRRYESSFDSANEILLSWHDINVFVKPAKRKWNIFRETTADEEPRCILKNVSGKVEPGQLLAIMGASGAGKTTLMNVLTNRNLRKVQVTGDVKVNGFQAGSSLARHSAYVQQDDLFIGILTVKEHLVFQAMLRMDKHLSYKERMTRVENAIADLGLLKCADTKIGIPGEKKGISGGERKRLAFACEVLTNPAVMFCDEPTSGLDSYMSMSIVKVLKKLARGGRTIICTIHQPSSEVYELFNNVLLMAEGRVAYMGERTGAIPFFEKIGLHVPANYNPADFFIFNLAVIPGKTEVCREQINRICEEFEKKYRTNFEKEVEESGKLMPNMVDQNEQKPISRYKASFFAQMKALMWRSCLTVFREPQLFRIRLLQTLVISVLLGLIYFNQKLDQRGIMNINGVMFLMLTNMSFTAMYAVINVFCTELPIFLRDHDNAMYRTAVYFICKTTADMPFFIILPILSTSIMYWMIGLKPELSAFFICVTNVILVSNCAASFGYLLSCASNSIAMALSIGSPLIVPLLLFGGYFLNDASIPVYFFWIKYLSWYFYANQVMAVNQWRNVQNITCELGHQACMRNGEAVLVTLNFHQDDFLKNILLLLVLFLLYRILAFVFLLIKSSKRT